MEGIAISKKVCKNEQTVSKETPIYVTAERVTKKKSFEHGLPSWKFVKEKNEGQ